MAVEKREFAICNLGVVYAYTLTNSNGLTAEILNYGGIIRKLIYEDTDVVLGYDTLEEYLSGNGYFCCLIGRNSNRIENSEFELNGKIYKLFANDGDNNLHSGKFGFDKKVWDVQIIDNDEPGLILTTISPNEEEGFPGTVNVKVTYTLTKNNSLKIHYEAESDADTIFNMTNHAYFNLNGHASGTVDSHILWMDSDFYTPNFPNCIPTGEILAVAGTPFEFGVSKTIGERFSMKHQQTEFFGGFDHNFVLNGKGYRKVAVLRGDKSSIAMEVYTDRPGVQLYTGNCIEVHKSSKDCAVYGSHSGLCLETQTFPNNLKYSHFPTSILRKGEVYDTTTEYKFI